MALPLELTYPVTPKISFTAYCSNVGITCSCCNTSAYNQKFGFTNTFLEDQPDDFFNPLRQVHEVYETSRATFIEDWFDNFIDQPLKELTFLVPPLSQGARSHELVDTLVARFCGISLSLCC